MDLPISVTPHPADMLCRASGNIVQRLMPPDAVQMIKERKVHGRSY